MPPVRFVAGAEPQTYLVRVGALGGLGLVYPQGSFVRIVNNHRYRGSRASDKAALGNVRDRVWHHYHNFVSTEVNAGQGTMFLLKNRQHRAVHRGGIPME